APLVACCSHRFKVLIYLKRFGAPGCGALVSTSKFLAQMTKPRTWPSDQEAFGPTVSPQLVQSGKGRIASDRALLNLPRPSSGWGLFPLAPCPFLCPIS